MAQIQITFSGTATDLSDFCTTMGYADTIPNPTPQPAEGEAGYDTWTATIANTETKTAFFQRKVKEYVWGTVKGYRIRQAEATAIGTVADVNF